MERLEALQFLLDKWEDSLISERGANQMKAKVMLPLGPDQVQEYMVENSWSIGRSVRFCGIGQPSVRQPFRFIGGGEVGGFTLAWRQTNFPLPVLTGISLHWATGLTDSVGQVFYDYLKKLFSSLPNQMRWRRRRRFTLRRLRWMWESTSPLSLVPITTASNSSILSPQKAG